MKKVGTFVAGASLLGLAGCSDYTLPCKYVVPGKAVAAAITAFSPEAGVPTGAGVAAIEAICNAVDASKAKKGFGNPADINVIIKGHKIRLGGHFIP